MLKILEYLEINKEKPKVISIMAIIGFLIGIIISFLSNINNSVNTNELAFKVLPTKSVFLFESDINKASNDNKTLLGENKNDPNL